MNPTVDDLYEIERTSRHLRSAIQRFGEINPKHVTLGIRQLGERMERIDATLVSYRDVHLARLGLTMEDVSTWGSMP